jgi:GxxExxY protein
MSDLIFKNEAYQIIGGCMAVYKDKGHGFVEPVYQDCMEIELEHLNIPFSAQATIPLYYRQRPLKHTYTPDLLCYGKIIVELKAVKNLIDEHRAQVINYLKASGLQLGLLVNFGHYPGLEWERIVLTK